MTSNNDLPVSKITYEKYSNRKMKNVLLDLDETIISGKATSDEIDFARDKEQLLKYTFHNMDDLYLIMERPGVQTFLTNLFKNYNVSV